MSGILNKLGLGHSSASETSTTSHSHGATTSHSSSTHTSTTAPSTTSTTTTGYNTVNKTGYADNVGTTSAYAHTNPGAVTSQTTTTTTTTTAANQAAYGTTAAAVNTAANTADAYMTRSEERLLVGKEQVGAGVASLNKYVTSEHVHTAVPITREHVVIEREPITAADAVRGAEIKEAHIEVALTEERAVAAKETVAVEKVKLRKEVEHTTQNVDAELRKEHIEFGTTNETTHAKTLGAAPGTAGYTATTTDKTYNTTTGANVDPVANPRV